MLRSWSRMTPWLVLVCLAGQGLLLGMGNGSAPAPLWPWLFILLTLVLGLAVAIGGSHRQPATLAALVRTGALAGLAVVVVLAAWNVMALRRTDQDGSASGGARHELDEAVAALTSLAPSLEQLRQSMTRNGDEADDPAQPGDPWDLARQLVDDSWPDLQAASEAMPLEVVLWREGERQAWSAGARPLPMPAVGGEPELLHDRGTWLLREVWESGEYLVSCQVHLEAGTLGERWPGLTLGPDAGAGELSEPLRRRIILAEITGGPVIVATIDPGEAGAQRRAARALRWVLLLLVWYAVSVACAWLLGGAVAGLSAAWLGRILLAKIDINQWVSAAWPRDNFPVPPDSLASLFDPAYFATPFAAGVFASAADALVTGMLLGVTVVHLVRHRSGRSVPEYGSPVQAVASGLATGAALLAARYLVSVVAENANARLIGPGVPVDFPSFWVLHLCLLLLGFAPLALAVGLVAPRRGRARTKAAAWREMTAAALAAGSLLAVAGTPWYLVAFGTVGASLAWTLAPSLVAGGLASLPRRAVWPLALVVASIWNYGALREVYSAAETAWLQNKRGVVTASDEDWNRYLLGDVLQDMQQREGGAVGGTGLWRDEAAWRLWQASALQDLGLPCLVEIVESEADGASLHTSGFLGDFQYEVVTRGPWTDVLGREDADADVAVFQTERRAYHGGEEDILAGEIIRRGDRGWLRVEIPVRSWRISTVMSRLVGDGPAAHSGYRPRAEIDTEVMLWRASTKGLEDAGSAGYPDADDGALLESLRRGEREDVVIRVDGRSWRCVWAPLPAVAARSPGEGFILGLRRSGPAETMLDVSRLLLMNLLLFGLGLGIWQMLRQGMGRWGGGEAPVLWRPGFQERFVGGTSVIGLVLLVLLGVAVDGVRQEQIRTEARAQTRAGLGQTVDQLRSLLLEQGRTLAASEYIGELLVGELVGGRPAGPMRLQQAMVFAADGSLLLDETLSDLQDDEAAELLDAARRAPLVVMREAGEIFVGTVIPIDLGGVLAEAGEDPGLSRRGPGRSGGFFFYRQRLDSGLLRSLADLVRGDVTLRLDGRPALASDPGGAFAGTTPLLAPPDLMAQITVHPAGAMVYGARERPFAPTGCQPLPVFARGPDGGLGLRDLPGVLEVGFPDRARLFAQQRRTTALFLAGLVNLVLLGALLLAVLMSWNIFRPLRLLMSATASLARGDYAAPLPEAGRDEVGQLTGAFASMRDDLQNARERLEARERFLSAVLDRVTVGVAVFDGQGLVVALNPTGRQVLADFQPALPEEEAASVLLTRLRAVPKERVRQGADLTSPDGTRTLRGAMAPLDLPDGRADTMLVFEDVTEYLENQRLAINAELSRQVAHEIKNPLTPIQLSAQLLQQAWRDKHPRLDSIMDDAITRILTQVELLRRIAGEFSLLGRPGDLGTEPLDLRHLVDETVAGYAGAGHSAPVVKVADAALPPVLGDLDSLRKILGNLMQNSLDAAPAGLRAQIEVDWEYDHETVQLIWRDEGSGIPEEVAGRLFDPYFSTKSKGTGLGLAICRNLTDRMGGRISLTNREDGRGAIARLTLQRAGQGPDSAGKTP
ncbi:hypothetical protein DRQ50_02320 [bacterium]|nr:MAG: hypothetical protein DRQ50_02320 [bacterium]